jgi:predicted transcriptional regulator
VVIILVTGKLIRELRNEAGLSQAELARLAKISQAHVARIERGNVDPRLSTVNRILRILVTKDRRKKCRGFMHSEIISFRPDDPVRDVVLMMKDRDISQFPVFRDGDLIGSVEEATIIRNMGRKLHLLQVRHIMDRPFPVIDARDPVEVAQGLLDFHPAVLVAEKGKVRGIITKSDLLGIK